MKTNQINTARLGLAMRSVLPVKIGEITIYVDAELQSMLADILDSAGNSSADVFEYLDTIKSQITEIQKGLRSL